MRAISASEPPPVGTAVARHALLWLTASATAGLIAASLLSFPRLGLLLGPFGYGRVVALHLELGLYGWTAIPMLGLVFTYFEFDRWPGRGGKLLVVWSAALVAGAASWLAGRTSGKQFLDWSGGARAVFLAMLAALYGAVLLTALGGWRGSRRSAVGRAATLAVLAAVPPVLALATRPDVYPPVDPATGAPTGVSLLASTLVLVAVLLALPRLAGLETPRRQTGLDLVLGLGIVAHAVFCAAVFGRERAHDEPLELLALASVLPWVALLALDYRRFEWPRASVAWARAAVAWGGILALTGVVQFLPGPLAAARYTHLLVAHAHAAMAGLTSSAAFVLLELVRRRERPLGGRRTFVVWQAATVLHVIALSAVGALETGDPAVVLRGSPAVSAWFAVRWIAGAGMLTAAALGLADAWERG